MASGTQQGSDVQRNVSHQERIERITTELKNLSPEKLELVDGIVMEFNRSR